MLDYLYIRTVGPAWVKTEKERCRPPSLARSYGRFKPGSARIARRWCAGCCGKYSGCGQSHLRADQFEALAREIPSVRDGQTIGLIADALRRDLEQLPLIQEKRERDDRILYGHGKTKRKGVNNA